MSDGDKKMQAAELFAEGLGYKAVATRLGVSKDTAKTWLYAYRAMGEEGLSRRHGRPPKERPEETEG